MKMNIEPGTPQITRRTTRSSSKTPTKSAIEISKNNVLVPTPSISNDLLFQESVSFDILLSSLPGRSRQIHEVLRLIGPPDSPMIPLFLYGSASSGKTSVILQIFRYLNRPFVYLSCRSCYNPRILFETVLNQLLLHRKTWSNSYSSSKRCEKVADFISLLKEALNHFRNNVQDHFQKSGSKESEKKINGKMVYLIFDNMELIRNWDKNSNILSTLFMLHDILKTSCIGLIFISRVPADAYYSNFGSTEPLPVFFPAYSEDDLRQILLLNQTNPKLYSCFLDAVLKSFCRVSRQVDEIYVSLRPLFKKYCEPLSDLGVIPDESLKRKLFSHLQPHIAPSLNQIFNVFSAQSVEVKKKKGIKKKLGLGNNLEELDFHLSVSAKYLLISAFLASRNPATLDAALFDSTGGNDRKKRRRKVSETSIGQKENAEQELLMKGPGTFPLERLLAIFQCITSVADMFSDEEQANADSYTKNGEIGLMSDILLQLSTLLNANVILKGNSCPLEGSTRYRCTVDEEMALKVARSVNFPLSKYLYRR